jgi:hypothetical protein
MWRSPSCCLSKISLVKNFFTRVEFSPSSGVTTSVSFEQCGLRLGGTWKVCTQLVIFSIKDKCQLCVKLHVALLFMHLFLWGFPVNVACVFPLLFCMNLCICRIFVFFNFK